MEFESVADVGKRRNAIVRAVTAVVKLFAFKGILPY